MLLVWGIVRLALRLLLVPGIGVVAAPGRGDMIKGKQSSMGGKGLGTGKDQDPQ
jgi:hypothetical protein